jgi:hypothetical protein
MAYPAERIDELRPYCKKVSALTEGGAVFLHLEALRLPEECEPAVCDGLLRPFAGTDSYPSQLYFSCQVKLPYGRNWNVISARICEKNWFAFSWKRTSGTSRLLAILREHLAALTQKS